MKNKHNFDDKNTPQLTQEVVLVKLSVVLSRPLDTVSQTSCSWKKTQKIIKSFRTRTCTVKHSSGYADNLFDLFTLWYVWKISIWVYHTNWSCTLCQQVAELKWINKWFNSSWVFFFVFVFVDTCTCVFTYLSSYQNIITRFWCISKLEYLNFKWCKRFS